MQIVLEFQKNLHQSNLNFFNLEGNSLNLGSLKEQQNESDFLSSFLFLWMTWTTLDYLDYFGLTSFYSMLREIILVL